MSRVEHRFQLVGNDADALRSRLTTLGWKTERTGDEVSAKQGSQFVTRTLGGWFVNASKLPKRLVARRAARGFDVTVQEALGVGHLDRRLRTKYEQAFAELEQLLTG